MNRLSMDLSELTLDPANFDEETWLTGPDENGFDENVEQEDEEDLNKWLAGATKKVDFRTRSALTRRLEKKKQKPENKDRLKSKMDISLDMIEEVSNESNSERDRRQTLGSRSPATRHNILQPTPTSTRTSSDCTDGFDNNDDEEDLFYDANSSSMEGLQAHRANDVFVTPRETHQNVFASSTTSRSSVHNGHGANINHHSSATTATTPRRTAATIRSLKKSQSHFEEQPREDKESPFLLSAKSMNLSELERRANEQEQELRMELLTHQERLFSRPMGDSVSQHSRPNSSSSNSSSVNHAIATSRSVDFRSIGNSVTNSEMSSSRSNDGSIGDLCKLENRPTLNSRLPLPRRPTVAGRTGIPLPTSTPKTAA